MNILKINNESATLLLNHVTQGEELAKKVSINQPLIEWYPIINNYDVVYNDEDEIMVSLDSNEHKYYSAPEGLYYASDDANESLLSAPELLKWCISKDKNLKRANKEILRNAFNIMYDSGYTFLSDARYQPETVNTLQDIEEVISAVLTVETDYRREYYIREQIYPEILKRDKHYVGKIMQLGAAYRYYHTLSKAYRPENKLIKETNGGIVYVE